MSKEGYKDIKEEVIIKRTGRNFESWEKILDKFYKTKKDRKEAVKYLVKDYRVNAWWAQMLVTRYEFEKNISR